MTRQRHARAWGFSLVELLVALAIGSLIATVGAAAFIAAKKSYSLADETGRLREKIRVANHLIASDIRGAGYAGCIGSVANVVNTLNDPASFANDYTTPVGGSEATSGSAWSPTLDAEATAAAPLGGNDVIVVRGPSGELARLDTIPSSTSADLKVYPRTPPPLFDDDIVMITDCTSASIFQISNYTTANGNVVHNTGAGTPGNATKDLGYVYPRGSEIVRLTANTYFLRQNADANPALYRLDGAGTLVELVDQVEQMQITYGEDTDMDRSPNLYRDADEIGNWNNVNSVRICMLLRSESTRVARAAQTYTDCNGQSVTAADQRLRQAAWMTINLRNRTS